MTAFNSPKPQSIQELQTRSLKIIAQLNKNLKRHPSQVEILQDVLSHVYDLTQSPYVYCVLKHRLQDELELGAFWQNGQNIKFQKDEIEEIIQQIGTTLIQKIIQEQAPLYLANPEAIRDYEEKQGQALSLCSRGQSWLGVPMTTVDHTLGVLIVQDLERANAYREELVDILDVIGDVAASAIDYERLHYRVTIIGDVEQELTQLQANSEAELLGGIYNKLKNIRDIDIKNLSIVLYNKLKINHAFQVVVSQGKIRNIEDQDEQTQLLSALNQNLLAEIIEDKTPRLRINNEFKALSIDDVRDNQPASWMAVPMRIQGRAIGVFIVEDPDRATPESVYNKNDAEFLDILSDQAANAIYRFRSQQSSKILAEIENELSNQTELNQEKVFGILKERGSELVDVYNLCVFLYDSEQDKFSIALAYRQGQELNTSESAMAQQVWSNSPEPVLRMVLDSQKALILKTRQEVQQCFLVEDADRDVPKSWLGVPMRAGNQVVGVFVTFHMKQEGVYHEDDARLLDELSDSVALALANVKLAERDRKNFEQRINNLETLGDIYEEVRQNSLESVMSKILETAKEFTGADYADVWLYHRERNEIKLESQCGGRVNLDYKNDAISLNPSNPRKGISGYVFQSKKPYYAPNVTPGKDPYYIEVSPETRSELVVPLIFRGKVLGVLNFESKEEDGFSPNEQQLAETLTDSAAVAIEISRLKQQLESSKQQLQERKNELGKYQNLLEELISVVTSDSPQDTEAIADYIHQEASDLMDTDNMYFATYDDTTDLVEFIMVYVEGEQIEPYPSRTLHEGRGKTEEIIRTKTAIRHTSQQSLAWYSTEGRDYVNKHYDCPWLGVPILLTKEKKTKCLGVIATYSTKDEDKTYTENEQRILGNLARWSAITIHNAKITEQVAEQQNVLTRSLVAQDFIHRINSIAGTIPIRLQLLEMELQAAGSINIPDCQGYIQSCQDEFQNLLTQVNQLKNPEPERVINLNTLLSSLLTEIEILYHQDLTGGTLTLERDIPESLKSIKGFPSLVANSFEAILKNGVEAVLGKGRGILRVEACNLDLDTVEVVIQDTGVGLSENLQLKVFTPFFTTKPRGTGYGLWRAKTVFENMGGEIEFDSDPEIKTKVTVTLPTVK
ncbi:GAF domain-containing protein [Sodalinema gerasimenkoae]|uniref:GAF domain-containing protein n=1 Tax=Sodalinema gerasimenkoae TaxID=2862348 RepID=UPI001359E5B4|nr:GAF domain-containing protein [Sodalinema gerasimenkoae]